MRIYSKKLATPLISATDIHVFFPKTLKLYCSQPQHFKSVFANVFLINMNYEPAFFSNKKISSFGQDMLEIFSVLWTLWKNIPSFFLTYFLFFKLYLLLMIHMSSDAVRSMLSRYIVIIEKKSNYNSLEQEKSRGEIQLRCTVVNRFSYPFLSYTDFL